MTDAESRFVESAQSAGTCRSSRNGSRADRRGPSCGRGSSAPARRLAGLALVGAVGCLSLLFAASASALDTGHSYSFSIKPTGAEELGWYMPGLTVDNSSGPSSGDVYVTDYIHHRIEKFDSAGNFILMFGDEVNETTGGDVCTATSGDTCKEGKSGSGAQQFTCPQYAAVDPSSGPSSGDYYIADTCTQKIHKYDENGNLITTWGEGGVYDGSELEEGPFAYITGIDVDDSGNLRVAAVKEFSKPPHIFTILQNGAELGAFETKNSETSPGLAWTPGYLYKFSGEEGTIRRWTEDGTQAVIFTKSPGGPPYANDLATDHSRGTLYVSVTDYGEIAQIWEYRVNGSGQPVDALGNACATTLTPTGPGCDPTNKIPAFSYGGFGVDEATNTIYETTREKYRVDVFIDKPAPLATTEAPVGNKEVAGTVKPDGAGEITGCWFEYGSSVLKQPEAGTKVPCSQGQTFSSDTQVTAELPLTAEQTYHYRVAAENANGAVSFGQDRTITPHNVSGLQALAPESVTRTSATLRGSFEGNGQPTSYQFEWGLSSEGFPNVTTLKSAGSPTGTETVAEPISGLTAQKTYHFRISAENTNGKTTSAPLTFTTANAVNNIATEAATGVERKSATLHGSFDGDGTPTTWQFVYGETICAGSETPLEDAGSPSGHETVSAPLTTLAPGHTYHFCLVATDESGTTKGNELSFSTPPAVAGLATKPYTNLSQESVTLNGEFTGNGEDTQYWFEYGLTTAYGSKSPVTDGGNASGLHEPSAVINDFEAYETYHYRFVAENSFGETLGEDMTFTAEPAPLPEVASTDVSGITPTGATFEAQLNPNGWATVYSFEYGTSNSYGRSTESGKPIGSDRTLHAVGDSVQGLAPETVYHFRVVATNFTGTTYGPDRTFFTPDTPRIDSSSASSVSRTGAHLSSLVSPNAGDTSVRFEYGLTTGYGSQTGATSIGSDTGVHSADADISGLEAGSVYHFRVVATNQYGTTNGPDQTFTTQSPAVVLNEAPPKVTCKRGFVKKHGKCVKRPKHKKHRKHHRHGKG